MQMNWISILLGFVLGVVSSLVASYIREHVKSPPRFGPQLENVKYDPKTQDPGGLTQTKNFYYEKVQPFEDILYLEFVLDSIHSVSIQKTPPISL